jgi:hypothetical protein
MISDNQRKSEPHERGAGHDQSTPQPLQSEPMPGVTFRRHGGTRATNERKHAGDCEQEHQGLSRFINDYHTTQLVKTSLRVSYQNNLVS